MILPSLFKSKRFYVAVLDLAFMVLVAFVPRLPEQADILIPAALALIGLVIGGYTVQDAVSAYKGENKYLDK